ncbi:hypothetical protein SKAU_G00189150 [Synaphobranchus kaupii]|uniref:Uncharacterized protein n=1 Tax=Synaphobranchus kaupii TaxID=118154 RepID=A0A9Q1FDC8_SYNKA|nr:hypothetical protein SKAU_G00189150 [Synaphobranchus kaupii]
MGRNRKTVRPVEYNAMGRARLTGPAFLPLAEDWLLLPGSPARRPTAEPGSHAAQGETLARRVSRTWNSLRSTCGHLRGGGGGESFCPGCSISQQHTVGQRDEGQAVLRNHCKQPDVPPSPPHTSQKPGDREASGPLVGEPGGGGAEDRPAVGEARATGGWRGRRTGWRPPACRSSPSSSPCWASSGRRWPPCCQLEGERRRGLQHHPPPSPRCRACGWTAPGTAPACSAAPSSIRCCRCPPYLQTARTTMVLSCVLAALGLCLASLGLKCTRWGGGRQAKGRTAVAGGACFLLAGLLCLVPASWFTNEVIASFLDSQRAPRAASSSRAGPCTWPSCPPGSCSPGGPSSARPARGRGRGLHDLLLSSFDKLQKQPPQDQLRQISCARISCTRISNMAARCSHLLLPRTTRLATACRIRVASRLLCGNLSQPWHGPGTGLSHGPPFAPCADSSHARPDGTGQPWPRPARTLPASRLPGETIARDPWENAGRAVTWETVASKQNNNYNKKY